MVVEKIDENQLLFVLSSEDLKIIEKAISGLFSNDIDTKKLVKGITSINKAGFLISDKSMIIEAIPQNSGCFILVTFLTDKESLEKKKLHVLKSNSNIYVFKYRSLNNLIYSIKAFYKKNISLLDAKVLKSDKSYFFVLKLSFFNYYKILPVLTEFGKLHAKGELNLLRLYEHTHLVAEKDDVAKLKDLI